MSTGCNCNKGLLLSFSLARTQHVLPLLEKGILKKARARIIVFGHLPGSWGLNFSL